MIGISKLYCGGVEPSDALRYGRMSKRLPSRLLQFSEDKKPVVVWNVTRACNLRCGHCYAHALPRGGGGDMSWDQARDLIDDLAAFGTPVVLLSGGEPLASPRIYRIAEYAVQSGLRAVLSTNGTLIDRACARRLASLGLSYVGVSLDGLRAVNDRFRGVGGAFELALRGIRFCREAGIKVGLRYTLTRENLPDLEGVFDLLVEENIPRVCFYHLVATGRAANMSQHGLGLRETRAAVDEIIDWTAALHQRGLRKEVLTVDNHTDGPYLYLRMKREGNRRSEKVMELLNMTGGNSSGIGIGCVSWDGTVYADQFLRNHPLGNVCQREFSRIWTDPGNRFLDMLRDKRRHIEGRCSECRFFPVCAGNFRARAEAVTGNLWASDPACYLTDEEIGIA